MLRGLVEGGRGVWSGEGVSSGQPAAVGRDAAVHERNEPSAGWNGTEAQRKFGRPR